MYACYCLIQFYVICIKYLVSLYLKYILYANLICLIDKFCIAGGRFRGGRFSGGRGHDPLVGRTIKIRSGPLKGYRGRVKEVTGLLVRVELDSQMKVVTGKIVSIFLSCPPTPATTTTKISPCI